MLIINLENPRALERTPAVSFRWGSTCYDSEALFWEQPYSIEEGFIASSADEWFRAQPNTPFGNMLGPEYRFDKQVFANDEAYIPLNVAMKNEVGCIEQKIFTGTNLYKTTQSMQLSCSNSEFEESEIEYEQVMQGKADLIATKDNINLILVQLKSITLKL